MTDVAHNIAAVRERIARAAERVGRSPADIRLIAVSKSKPAALIRAALDAGVTDIAENYVQEAAAKRPEVGWSACWHLIGHLQRNKARKAVRIFDYVQSVDRTEIALALNHAAGSAGRTLRVLVEVNLGNEPSKSGCRIDELQGLLAEVRQLPYLCVEGLMAIPPLASPEETRRHFRCLRELAARHGLGELSMGMSDDFEVAVEEGATMLRIGRAIFGERA